MIRKKGDLLFFKNGELRAFLEEVKAKLKKEIETYEPNYILNVSEHDLQEYLISKYSIESPKLIKENLYVDGPYEVDIDISQDPNKFIIDRNRPVYIKGTKVVVVVPFSGDGRLFYYKPSTFSQNPLRGEVKESGVHLIYELTEHDSEMLKQGYQRDLNEIEKYLEWIYRDVNQFNENLKKDIRQFISQRKNKLLKDMNLVSSLEIPIKRSENLPTTYSIPLAPKKLKINRPKASVESFKPEPTLSLQEYENILEILLNMSIAMERSPKVFSRLKEEEIRDFFLVMLNAHYGGQATGETFNFTGKTDILIRYEGGNVFIAECKFWRGEKKLMDAVNQLLRYCSWRDTKTAILLFNKNKEFTSVLEKISTVMREHPHYKRDFELNEEKFRNDSIFSYVFHLPQDRNREVIITVMAFDIPKGV